MRAALRGGRGRSGKKSKRSFSSLPCTSRTSCGLRGFGTAATPRSGGGGAAGPTGRGCASASPLGARAMPRIGGQRDTPRRGGTVPILERGYFFVITAGEIAYTLASARRGDREALEGGLWHGPRRRAKVAAREAQVASQPRRARRSVRLVRAQARHVRPRARVRRAKAQPNAARRRARRKRPRAAPNAPGDASRRQHVVAALQRGRRQQRRPPTARPMRI